jgi:hypothetical protein
MEGKELVRGSEGIERGGKVVRKRKGRNRKCETGL